MRTTSARRVWQTLGMGVMGMLVVGLLQAAVAVQAQEPEPEDPMKAVPVHWYANPGGATVYGPPLPSFGEAVTDNLRGDWEIQIDWQNWDTFWENWQAGHPDNPNGPIQTGVVGASFSSSWLPEVRWTAGIWEADELGRFSPASAFQGTRVQFWMDGVADGVLDTSAPGDLPDALMGEDLANTKGDGLCPISPCIDEDAPPATQYGVLYTFSISLESGNNNCGAENPMPGGISSGIPHFFTVHSRNMTNPSLLQDFTCLDSLAGQIWNCQANGNCEGFE